MSGPVWRFEPAAEGLCDVCLREAVGLFVEGEVKDNELRTARRVCPSCLHGAGPLVINGEAGTRQTGPAYARR